MLQIILISIILFLILLGILKKFLPNLYSNLVDVFNNIVFFLKNIFSWISKPFSGITINRVMWLFIIFSAISTSAGAYIILGNFKLGFVPNSLDQAVQILVSIFTAILLNIGLGYLIESLQIQPEEKKQLRDLTSLKMAKNDLEEQIDLKQTEIAKLAKKDSENILIPIIESEIRDLKSKAIKTSELIHEKELEVGIVFGGYKRIVASKPINNSNLIGSLSVSVLVLLLATTSLLLSLVGLNKSYKDFQIQTKLEKVGFDNIQGVEDEFDNKFGNKSASLGQLLIDNKNKFEALDRQNIDAQIKGIQNEINSIEDQLVDAETRRDSFDDGFFGQNQTYQNIITEISNKQQQKQQKEAEITVLQATGSSNIRQAEAENISNVLNNVTLSYLNDSSNLDTFSNSFNKAKILLKEAGETANNNITINRVELENLVELNKDLIELSNEDRFFDFVSIKNDIQGGGLSLNNIYFLILLLLAIIGDVGPVLIFLFRKEGNIFSSFLYNLGLFILEILEDIKNIIWWVITCFVSLISIKHLIEQFQKGSQGVALIPTFISSVKEFFFGSESIPNSIAKRLYETFNIDLRWGLFCKRFLQFLNIIIGFAFVFLIINIPPFFYYISNGNSWNSYPIYQELADFTNSTIPKVIDSPVGSFTQAIWERFLDSIYATYNS